MGCDPVPIGQGQQPNSRANSSDNIRLRVYYRNFGAKVRSAFDNAACAALSWPSPTTGAKDAYLIDSGRL